MEQRRVAQDRGAMLRLVQLLAGSLCLRLPVLLVVGEEALQQVSFSNFRATPLGLRWDDGTENGVSMGEIPAMDTITLDQTFVGHRFKLVEQDGGGSGPKVVSQFVMKPNQHTYVVEPLREDPAFLRFLEAQKEGQKRSVADELKELHKRGKLRAVTLKSQARPRQVRPAFGMAIKNFRRDPCNIFWDNGSPEGVYNGDVSPMSSTTGMTTYPGDAFKIICKSELVERFVMNPNQRAYVLEPEPSDRSTRSSPEYLRHQREAKEAKEYLTRTGMPWLGAHPPDPASNPMYAAGSSIGQVAHTVNVRGLEGPRDLVALSWSPVGPRAFMIENVLTPEECAHVISISKDRLRSSLIGAASGATGGFESKTRTSKMTFINRATTNELEAMHHKFADILNLSDQDLRLAAEDLQVVRYEQGQEYAPHYDYSKDGSGDRLATLLIYLESGGGTIFPRAFDDRGLMVHPKQGDAVLFYSQLPDGNLDELSLHGGMPVASGTKWVCNLWLHSHSDRKWNAPRPQRPEL